MRRTVGKKSYHKTVPVEVICKYCIIMLILVSSALVVKSKSHYFYSCFPYVILFIVSIYISYIIFILSRRVCKTKGNNLYWWSVDILSNSITFYYTELFIFNNVTWNSSLLEGDYVKRFFKEKKMFNFVDHIDIKRSR